MRDHVSHGDVRRLVNPHNPHRIENRAGMPCPYLNEYKGRGLVLLCGGPSLSRTDLAPLSWRGVTVMGLNNSWLVHKPHFWVSVDPPDRFAYEGWADPTIVKFSPSSNRHSKLRRPDAALKVQDTDLTPLDMPNVWYYVKETTFNHETFMDPGKFQWGSENKALDSLGNKGGRSVMLVAVKLAMLMGFNRLYLVGADFNMPAEGPAYAWSEAKHTGARVSNNRLYASLNKRFSALRPYLEERGLQVLNCTPSSNLTAFEKAPLSDVCMRERELLGPHVESGWYKAEAAPPKPKAPVPLRDMLEGEKHA